MFEFIFSKSKPAVIPPPIYDSATSKRRHSRRGVDHCVCEIDEQTYPVENWSMGGMLIFADPRFFGIDDELPVTLKFKLSYSVIEVPHKARVVRKSQDKVAFEFAPVTSQAKRLFQNVVDDYVVSKFSDSQMA